MLLAVIGDIRGIADGDALVGFGVVGVRHNGLAGDAQFAFGLGNGVVAILELFTLCESNRIGHLAFGHGSHRAGSFDFRYFACHKAVTFYLDIGPCERRAVISLAGSFGSQSNGAFGDLIGFFHLTSIVADTGNGNRDRAYIGEIAGAVGYRVVGIFFEGYLCACLGYSRLPLMRVAVIGDTLGIINVCHVLICDIGQIFPNGVQIVAATFGDVEFIVCLIFHSAVFLGGPACKLFALGGFKVCAQSGRVFRDLLAVGGQILKYLGLIAVVISQRQVFRRFAVHSRQRYITRYGDGLAGQKRGIVVQLPILELQAFAVLRVENGRRAALCILCGILPWYVVFNISDRTLGGIAYVIGRQGDIFIQLGVQIEDHAVNHPCIRLQLFCQSIPLSGITQLAAVRHRDRLGGAILHGNGHGDLRGCPFCIQGNVFGGHGALKLKCIALAQFVCIPASELIVGRNIIRFFRLVVYIRNGLLELAAFPVNDRFAAIENDVIAVAGIVELCVIVALV